MALKALIFGVSGQDGAYLSKHLTELGYEVYGTSRAAAEEARLNLDKIGVDGVKLYRADPRLPADTERLIGEIQPDEIYNLAGQSSVGRSFGEPIQTYESIVSAGLNVLEATRAAAPKAKLFQAGSTEIFGQTGRPAVETDPYIPRSPYAAAKAAMALNGRVWRDVYGLYVCTGFLSNHESPLRPDSFVTTKVVRAAVRISRGSAETLSMGNVDVERDWGWAPQFVTAFHSMLHQAQPEDLILATGHSVKLADFVAFVFAALELDWRNHVEVDPALIRSSEALRISLNPSRAFEKLGWRAETNVEEVARRLVAAEVESA